MNAKSTGLLLGALVLVGGVVAFGAWRLGWVDFQTGSAGGAGFDPNPDGGASPWDHDVLLVPGGSFLMGAQAADPGAPGYDADAAEDEAPPRRVTLSPYYIDLQEVTAAEFQACVDAGGCEREHVSWEGGYFNLGVEGRGGHPANGVTWAGAAAFCAWRQGRLPTEAEWEFAARGPESHPFPAVGYDPCQWRSLSFRPVVAKGTEVRCDADSTMAVAAMGDFSHFGVLGMTSNVVEWVADWYAPDAYATGTDRDPTGPATGTERVQRGGSYTYDLARDLRASARAATDPDMMMDDVGFRCVYGAERPPRHSREAGPPPDPTVVGPLVQGQPLVGGWWIGAFKVVDEGVEMRLTDGETGMVVLVLVVERGDGPEGMVSLGQSAIYHRHETVPYERFEPAALEVARRLSAAAGEDAVEVALARWIAEGSAAADVP